MAEVEEMLSMFHELGVLVHLTTTQSLRQIVTMKPQWLIDGICRVIRDPDLHPIKDNEVENAGLTKDLSKMYESGLASWDLLEFLLVRNDRGEFRDQTHFLLDLMKHMILLSDWKFNKEKLYLIPSLLKDRPRNQLHGDLSENENGRVYLQSASACIFDFSKKFLPVGIFQRVVCICVSFASTLHTRNDFEIVSGIESYEPILYNNWAKIWLGPEVAMCLQQENESEILLSCIYVAPGDANSSNNQQNYPVTCYNIVLSTLRKLNADLMGNGLEWEIFFETLNKHESSANIASSDRFPLEEAKNRQLLPWFVEIEEIDDEAANTGVNATGDNKITDKHMSSLQIEEFLREI
uniref:COR domain-containing protein n=2 Tax=Aplanochytrium stocchinoi TaxID=215587 RepID=A0A7S3PK06_9STRA